MRGKQKQLTKATCQRPFRQCAGLLLLWVRKLTPFERVSLSKNDNVNDLLCVAVEATAATRARRTGRFSLKCLRAPRPTNPGFLNENLDSKGQCFVRLFGCVRAEMRCGGPNRATSLYRPRVVRRARRPCVMTSRSVFCGTCCATSPILSTELSCQVVCTASTIPSATDALYSSAVPSEESLARSVQNHLDTRPC